MHIQPARIPGARHKPENIPRTVFAQLLVVFNLRRHNSAAEIRQQIHHGRQRVLLFRVRGNRVQPRRSKRKIGARAQQLFQSKPLAAQTVHRDVQRQRPRLRKKRVQCFAVRVRRRSVEFQTNFPRERPRVYVVFRCGARQFGRKQPARVFGINQRHGAPHKQHGARQIVFRKLRKRRHRLAHRTQRVFHRDIFGNLRGKIIVFAQHARHNAVDFQLHAVRRHIAEIRLEYGG